MIFHREGSTLYNILPPILGIRNLAMLLLVLVGYNFIQFCIFRLSKILFNITTKHLFQKLH